MRVRDVMTTPIATVREGDPLTDVAKLLLEKRIGGVPVVDAGGKLRGIVSRSDFEMRAAPVPFSAFQAPQLFGKWVSEGRLEELYREAGRMTAREIMSSPVITATEDESLDDVLRRMLEQDVNRIPVVRDGVPLGMISHRTLLNLLLGREKG